MHSKTASPSSQACTNSKRKLASHESHCTTCQVNKYTEQQSPQTHLLAIKQPHKTLSKRPQLQQTQSLDTF